MINRFSLYPHPLYDSVRLSKEFFEPLDDSVLGSDIETEDENKTSNLHKGKMFNKTSPLPIAINEEIDPFLISDFDDEDDIQLIKGSAKNEKKTSHRNALKRNNTQRIDSSSDICDSTPKKRTNLRSNKASSAKKTRNEATKSNGKKANNKKKKEKKKSTVYDLELDFYAEEESNDEEQNEEYEVEKIIQKSLSDIGEIIYFVKWKGWSNMHNTWEPLDNLEGCKLLIDEFEEKYKEYNSRGLTSYPPDSDDDDDDYENVVDDSDSGSENNDRVNLKEMIKKFMKKYFSHIDLDNQHSQAEYNDIREDGLKELAPKQEITNFIIDDAFPGLIRTIGLTNVGYIPTYLFSAVYADTGVPTYDKYENLFSYINRYSINTADYIFVACSTNCAEFPSATNHFILGVICKSKQKIIVLDSLRVSKKSTNLEKKQRNKIFESLGMITAMNFKLMNLTVDLTDWDLIYSTDCPQQNNNFDCGVYTIINAIYIMLNERPPKDTLRFSTYARRFIYHIVKIARARYPELVRKNSNLGMTQSCLNDTLKAGKEFRCEFDEYYIKGQHIKIQPASQILKSLINRFE